MFAQVPGPIVYWLKGTQQNYFVIESHQHVLFRKKSAHVGFRTSSV